MNQIKNIEPISNAIFFFHFVCVYVCLYISVFIVEVTVDDNPVKVELADTAGQDFLDPLRRLCYPDSDVFLLCFSVIKPDTFVAAQEKWEPIFRKTHKPIILIGTQSDLRNDSAVISQLLVNNIHCYILFLFFFKISMFHEFENIKFFGTRHDKIE